MKLILLLILAAMPASAAEPYADWKYGGRIQAPEEPFVALPLTAQNLDLSEKPDLADFRIVDMRGVEVPYAVVFETETINEKTRKGMILNREYPDRSTSRITVDFGASITKNKITVETEGNNFRRSLRVEGSDNLWTWATILPEGWLIAAGDTSYKRFESFDIGSNNYRYMRISVRKMPEEESPPNIKNVSFLYTEVRKPPETALEGKLLKNETKDGKSIIEVDFGQRHLSLQHFQLQLGSNPDRIFRKRCILSGRNTLQHEERVRFESGERGKARSVVSPWRSPEFMGSSGEGFHKASDEIYRNTEGELSLDLKIPARFRYIRIEIDNGDSPPLDIDGVTAYMTPTYLVFEPAGQSRFDVYTGNAEATNPRYESAKVLGALDTLSLAKCSPVKLTQQSGFKQKAKPEGQLFVWIVLVVVVLFTAGIFWNTARRMGKDRAARSEDKVNATSASK